MRTTKNYTEHGGDTTIIGGVLKVDGGTIENAEGTALISNQVDSVATDVAGLVSDFNALLTKLKSSGLMEPDA